MATKIAGSPRQKEDVIEGPTIRPTTPGVTFVPPWRDMSPRSPDPVPEPRIPVDRGGNGSGGNDTGSGGGGTEDGNPNSSPFDRLADGFLAALGGGGSQAEDTTPYIVTDPNAGSEGSGMQFNVKTLAVIAVVGFAAWYAWKRWGKKAISGATGASNAA